MDKLTLNRISKAHPKIREQLREDYLYCNNKLLGKGVRLRFSWVYRTPDEQNTLYNKRPKVTNAKAWQSIHNYGLAFDIVVLYDKDGDGRFEEASWDMVRDGDFDGISDWNEIIQFFLSKGYEWGGNWNSFRDYPHFQKTFGNNWRDLKEMIDNKDTITDTETGIKYVNI